MGSTFGEWLRMFRLKPRHSQVSWMKSYALKQKKTNMHLTEEQFVTLIGSRMAGFLDDRHGLEATMTAVMIAKECFDGKYEPSKEYRKPSSKVALKFNALQPREPYVAPTYAKNDGDVHTIDLEAE